MSQLLAQKRHRLGDDEEESDESDDDEPSVKAGFIKKLTLKNFMCHDHFELEFGPQMNFIIGRNGSGKSAVLTGISVGLGAKATDTSRGSSIKSLIKDGKSTARIVVEIDNNGLDSYERETYGNTIIVERKLTREGSNAYAIKSETGALVSTKKRTLDDILQKFFIVVNNPLSFLSQDKAREFIANSTEQSRFNYFSEGSNIQSILLNYQEASKNILSLQSRLQAAQTYYEEACRKYDESERAYKKYKHSHTLRQQLEKINGKIFWFNVEVLERRMKKKDAEVLERQQEILNIDRSILDHHATIAVNNEDLVVLDNEQTVQKEKLQLTSSDNEKLEQQHQEWNKKIQGYRADLVNYKNEIEEYTNQIRKHQEDIEAEQKKIDEVNGGSKDEMKERLSMLKTRMEALLEKRDELQRQLRSLDGISPAMALLNKELEEHKSTKLLLQERMSSIEKSKNDKYAAFGYNINFLMRDIENEKRWHQKPLGPVGCYVSVKEEYSKWGDLINALLMKTLDLFVVCDEHDRRLLNQYMRSKKIFKSIIVRKFEKFNYETANVPNCTSMLDVLDFQDENIKFALIDSNGVEESVLCESLSQAEQATHSKSVKGAFCLSDRKSGMKFTRRAGILARDPVFYVRELRKLAGKVSGDDINTELQEVLHEEASVQQKRNRLRMDEQEQKKKIHVELEEKKKHLKEIQSQIFNTERVLQEEGDHGRIESLKGQIEICENQIKTREGMSVELLQNLNESKRSYTALKERVKEAREAKQLIMEELSDIKERMNSCEEATETLEAEIGSAETRKADILTDIDVRLAKKAADGMKHLELLQEAQERCERSEIEIAESDTTDSITTEFRIIQEAIEEVERNTLKSYEDIQNELLESKATKDNCETSLLELDNARITLENDLNSRFENLNITIKEKLTRAKLSFEQSLALRGFKGKLEFDFARKRVITEVQTKDDKETRAVQSLSGGEKSFTQIAFLLSIWKVMKPRVCGLDEFDVFMDSVNRTIAIRLLLHELRNSSAQSIFITPQDIAVVGDLRDSADVRIHRIKAPRND